ncbi:MAG: erythromycin esterase family protein [Longimicrobiales bacterium]
MARVWFDAATLEVIEPTEADAAAREEIGKIYARLDAAAGKTDVLLSVALPDAVAGSPTRKAPLAEWLKQWDSIREPGVKYTSKTEIAGVSLAGSEATVRVRQSATTTRDGTTRSSAATNTDKWARQDRDWKLKESLMTSYREVEPPTDPESTKRVVAELKQKIVPLNTPEAGKPYEDLAAFGKAVGDARIVALGEATHGTREIFQMKHRLLEYPVEEKGFTVFAIEANWPESQSLDRYVKTGEGDPKAGLREMYFWTWQTEEVLAMVEWMRAYNKDAGKRPKLSFTSFDMQTYKVALGRVVEYLTANAPADVATVESAYAKLRELVTSQKFPDPLFREAVPGAKRVVELMESQREALTKASSPAAFRDALQAARIVVQAAEVRTPGATSSYRDQMMAKNTEWLASEAFPGEKIVLWAHNGHVGTNGSEGFRPMGSWLRDVYRDRMYVLGFAIHKGDVRAVTWENGRSIGLISSPVPAAPEGSGSAVLSAAGTPIFFLNMKSLEGAETLSAWLGRRHLFRQCGAAWNREDAVNNNMGSSVLSRSFDGLIFFEESHAARGPELGCLRIPLRREAHDRSQDAAGQHDLEVIVARE